MKVLVLNGSPRGEKSNTLKLTEAFLEGLTGSRPVTWDIVHVYQKKHRALPGLLPLLDENAGAMCPPGRYGLFARTISRCGPHHLEFSLVLPGHAFQDQGFS